MKTQTAPTYPVELESPLNFLDSNSREEDGMPFFVCDLNEPVRRLKQWRTLLPMVEPHYAIKCNTHPTILKTLNEAGIPGFDCASKAEIKTILDMGVDPDRIIFANPCKQISHLKYARENNVLRMTFDNADELYKIKRVYPNAEVVLRVWTDDSRSVCRLGVKFGAPPKTTMGLLKLAIELGLNIVGVSFHVGSGCFDPTAFSDAVVVARTVFDEAESLGLDLKLLDIGGGFPGLDGVDGAPFADVAACLRPVLNKLFPSGVRIIAEPGRYFVAAAFDLAVNVTSRRVVPRDEDNACDSIMYYVNDGVYGSFNCLLFDHAEVWPKVLKKDGYLYDEDNSETEPVKSSIWGPTCDSMDCISKEVMLPELNIGDWIYFPNMGAYTLCAASTFNGFPLAEIRFCNVPRNRKKAV